MPRASREQSDRNRQVVTETASRLLRERGLGSVSVTELMREAGLTHGAFYSQFASRDELMALACHHAFDEANTQWMQRLATSRKRDALLRKYVNGYLSDAERSDLGGGCAAAAWCGELAHEEIGQPVRDAFVEGLEGMIENIGKLIEAAGEPPGRKRALASVAMLVGALTLARATRTDKLSDEILEAARDELIGKGRAT